MQRPGVVLVARSGRIYQRAQKNDKALEVWNRLEKQFPNDARVQEQTNEASADKDLLSATQDVSPMAFALLPAIDRHLTDLGFGSRMRHTDDAGNQSSAGGKQPEMQLLAFLVEILVVEAQPEGHTQDLIAEFAFLPVIL